MRQLIKQYNNLMIELEDWTFKWVIPPLLTIIQLGLKLAMWWALYMLVINLTQEMR